MNLYANGRPVNHPSEAMPPQCVLCGRPSCLVGLFVPHDDEMKSIVLTIRCTPIIEGRHPLGVAYGICRRHSRQAGPSLTERIEQKLIDAANHIRRNAS